MIGEFLWIHGAGMPSLRLRGWRGLAREAGVSDYDYKYGGHLRLSRWYANVRAYSQVN